jgi:hypothetical protein
MLGKVIYRAQREAGSKYSPCVRGRLTTTLVTAKGQFWSKNPPGFWTNLQRISREKLDPQSNNCQGFLDTPRQLYTALNSNVLTPI